MIVLLHATSHITGLTGAERPPGVVVRFRALRSFPHALAKNVQANRIFPPTALALGCDVVEGVWGLW